MEGVEHRRRGDSDLALQDDVARRASLNILNTIAQFIVFAHDLSNPGCTLMHATLGVTVSVVARHGARSSSHR